MPCNARPKMNITGEDRKKRLFGHGIEIVFFPVLLKFKDNFLCISETKTCLNSATILNVEQKKLFGN
ncbi:unnamed protein product [Rhizophagus irregularis]|nr:unnamed protein product [Rhizophagus irregularis]